MHNERKREKRDEEKKEYEKKKAADREMMSRMIVLHRAPISPRQPCMIDINEMDIVLQSKLTLQPKKMHNIISC